MLENTEYPITILVLTVAVSLSLVAVLIYCGLCGNDEDDDYEYFYTDPQNIKAFNRTMSKQQGMGARPSLMAALGGTQSVPRIFPSGSTTVMLQAGSQQAFDLGANPRFKPEGQQYNMMQQPVMAGPGAQQMY